MENSDAYSVCHKLDVDAMATAEQQNELRPNVHESTTTVATDRLAGKESQVPNQCNNCRNLNGSNVHSHGTTVDNNEMRSSSPLVSSTPPLLTEPPTPPLPPTTIQDGCVHYKRKAKFVVSRSLVLRLLFFFFMCACGMCAFG